MVWFDGLIMNNPIILWAGFISGFTVYFFTKYWRECMKKRILNRKWLFLSDLSGFFLSLSLLRIGGHIKGMPSISIGWSLFVFAVSLATLAFLVNYR